MSKVLIDSSVWISFFKGNENALSLMELIGSNRVCINDLILSELVPSLFHKKENHLVEILKSVEKLEISINWTELIQLQTINFKNGINRVGIPDLIIAQNSMMHDVELFTFDKHFMLMEKLHMFRLYRSRS